MTAARHAVLIFVLSLCALAAAAQAQTSAIEVAGDPDRVQFYAHGYAGRMRVEIFAPSGEMVFEGESAAGAPVVWGLTDELGGRAADGVYLATVTVADSSGRRRKRIEQITVSGAAAESGPAPQAVGPIEGEGTSGKIAKFTGPNAVGNSVITEAAGKVAVNSATPTATLQVNAAQPAAVAGNGTNAAVLLQTSGGKGGNTTGTTGQTGGAGADVSILAGGGGNAPAGSVNGRGGNLTLQPGPAGAGAGAAGATGNVLLAPTGVGNVGVGTNAPASKLTVAGGDVQITTANRGVKFADGSLQTKAGLTVVARNATLTGNGTGGAPLSVAPLGVGAAQLADGAVNGTKIALPLTLNGTDLGPTLTVRAATIAPPNVGGVAISARGAIQTDSQYNIGDSRVLSAPGTDNTFVGVNAGSANTFAGTNNSFYGKNAGSNNTDGSFNSFFGKDAGELNTTGVRNSFFGLAAGEETTTGSNNSFYGFAAGNVNSTGGNNSYFGIQAGESNKTSSNNSFFGALAGQRNSGSNNSFFGSEAGKNNRTASFNSFFGEGAGRVNTTGAENAFFGNLAGEDNTTGGDNSFYGMAAGANNTTGQNNSYFGRGAGFLTVAGQQNTVLGAAAGTSFALGNGNTLVGFNAEASAGLTNATAVGFSAEVTQSGSLVLGQTNVKVGIGTTAPRAKLHVEFGDVYTASAGNGVILKSPDGTKCARLSLSNAGALVATPLTCP